MSRFLPLSIVLVLSACGSLEVARDGGSTTTEQTDADGDGYTADDGDCNDADSAINPGAVDNDCDGVDQDCDGYDGSDTTTVPPPSGANQCGGVDTDGDGYMDVDGDGDSVDCDDSDASVNPGATEICGDGTDNDCSGGDADCSEPDTDGDGSLDSVDCNDADATVYPGATEIANDGIDQDCDGRDLVDVDCDGYTAAVDCDDSDASVNPGAAEICGDGTDNDCSGGDASCGSPDTDGDGSLDSVDCNDADATIYPGATESCNGIDDDCDGSVDEGVTSTWYDDDDGDGYGDASDISSASCSAPSGYVSNDDDCDDNDAAVKPGASEYSAWIDGEDNDCDGYVDEDWLAYVKVGYTSTGYYTLYASFYTSGTAPNAYGWQESDTETSGTTTSVEFLASDSTYASIEASACGLIVNVTVGSGAGYDWLCTEWAVDESVVIDAWFDGVWYDEDDVQIWIANATTGSCAAIIQTDSSSSCDPVNDI